ncbi:MAG: hydrogenase nickel incorporation protein HypB [Candidatus Aureabacteria bacterium]|nr:hydrogenase nickel incorporation protein HypB [Candidatus Auribacterota bacterium]
MKINVIKRVLKANDIVAQENREKFKSAGLLAVNIISSPGSGKTTLLEKTIPALGEKKSIVIVGDLETTRDAKRLEPYAYQVTQIQTGMSCHLYANQISESLNDLDIEKTDFLFIENVGNIVCPGEFDLGENAKVVLLSVPEGDDKVAKYPTIFRVADVVLITKIDLLGVLTFDLDRVKNDLAKLNSNVPIIKISSLKSDGMDKWMDWLKEKHNSSIGEQAKFVTE